MSEYLGKKWYMCSTDVLKMHLNFMFFYVKYEEHLVLPKKLCQVKSALKKMLNTQIQNILPTGIVSSKSLLYVDIF